MKESLVTKMLAFVMALFTGCSKFDREVMSDNQEAKQIMEQVIGYLQDGNADGVKALLSPKTISECKDNIDNQIEEAITAFSGKKTESYSARCTFSNESYRDGKLTYYSIRSEAKNIKFDTGEKYSIRIHYHKINKECLEKEGVRSIELKINDSNIIYIGKWTGG